MAQIRDRIALYVEDYFRIDSHAAHKIRYDYWRKYGTTLGGLMAEHGVDPHGYLNFVHDVDLSRLRRQPEMRAHIENLPGRKLIFTNADAPYAEKVLAACGLDGVFEDLFDIHRMDHRPKPDPASYTALCRELDIMPTTALFIEDSAHNLIPAKTMGMTTIWVNHGDEADSSAAETHIDQIIGDVGQWLATIKQTESVS